MRTTEYILTRLVFVFFTERIEQLNVVDIYENEVDKVAGPYEEQSALYLKCRATGGNYMYICYYN